MFDNLFETKIQKQLATPMRVVCYMRTNSEERAQERIDQQYAEIKRFIEARNSPWQTVLAYRDVNQRSINTALLEIGRTLYERDIGQIDAIIVASIDRISRTSPTTKCLISGYEVDVISVESAPVS